MLDTTERRFVVAISFCMLTLLFFLAILLFGTHPVLTYGMVISAVIAAITSVYVIFTDES